MPTSYLDAAKTILSKMRQSPLMDGIYYNGQYSRITAGTYDTATGDTTAGTRTSTAIRARVESFSAREIDNSVILHTDRRISLEKSVIPLEPKGPDEITVYDFEGQSSVTFSVVMVMGPSPGLTWAVQARSQSL